MKRTVQSFVATLLVSMSPLYAQQTTSLPDSKAIASPVVPAGQSKPPNAADAKNRASTESIHEARKERREHRKTVNHRQRRKH